MTTMRIDDDAAEDVLRFWFPAEPYADAATLAQRFDWWFRGGGNASIARRYRSLHEQAARGELDHWTAAPRPHLALIVVLDQFSRALHAGTPRAYAQDAKAQQLALQAVVGGHYAALGNAWEKTFCLLPLGHAESLAALDRAVSLAEALIDEVPPHLAALARHSASQARAHRAIVQRFGRQPHRNAILGRNSTAEERAYLAHGDFVHLRALPL
jgi:uncharacterized protein (DUF924 family)